MFSVTIFIISGELERLVLEDIGGTIISWGFLKALFDFIWFYKGSVWFALVLFIRVLFKLFYKDSALICFGFIRVLFIWFYKGLAMLFYKGSLWFALLLNSISLFFWGLEVETKKIVTFSYWPCRWSKSPGSSPDLFCTGGPSKSQFQ